MEKNVYTVSNRAMFVNFYEKESVNSNEYVIIRNDEYDVLEKIHSVHRVIVLININMSSHFMNIIRKKLGNKNYKYILGGDELNRLLKEPVGFVVNKLENTICINNIIYMFEKFDSYENLSYDIDFNLVNNTYCLRPNKKYGLVYLEYMKEALEGFHDRKCFIYNDQIWYLGGFLPTELFEWCSNHFDDYLTELSGSFQTFENILSSNDIDNSRAIVLLKEYYYYTDYIGALIDVVSYKIWGCCQPERIFKLQEISSIIFTVTDSETKAIEALEALYPVVGDEKKLKMFLQLRMGDELIRIECWYIILNVLSDIRRKAMISLKSKNQYVNVISKREVRL